MFKKYQNLHNCPKQVFVYEWDLIHITQEYIILKATPKGYMEIPFFLFNFFFLKIFSVQWVVTGCDRKVERKYMCSNQLFMITFSSNE